MVVVVGATVVGGAVGGETVTTGAIVDARVVAIAREIGGATGAAFLLDPPHEATARTARTTTRGLVLRISRRYPYRLISASNAE